MSNGDGSQSPGQTPVTLSLNDQTHVESDSNGRQNGNALNWTGLPKMFSLNADGYLQWNKTLKMKYNETTAVEDDEHIEFAKYRYEQKKKHLKSHSTKKRLSLEGIKRRELRFDYGDMVKIVLENETRENLVHRKWVDCQTTGNSFLNSILIPAKF